jgi:hypothetical protein
MSASADAVDLAASLRPPVNTDALVALHSVFNKAIRIAVTRSKYCALTERVGWRSGVMHGELPFYASKGFEKHLKLHVINNNLLGN